jgi:tRNA nucleotidyltransferase (CCA-adding enzyme)
MADYIYTMESRLSPEQMRTVNAVQQLARSHGMNVYLTGGAIRDILTGFPIRDLDFTVQGNPLEFQHDIEASGGIVDMVDQTFYVIHAIFQGTRAEIGMARAEVFDKPGKPPLVTPATINEDLRRRDFTFNAMALSLNDGSRGLLLDPFNGAADIEARSIRVLHSYAFLEDPSRLIRATRFATRFGWEFEERTRTRYDSAREGEYIQFLGNRAIGYEIEQIAHEENPVAVMQALEAQGWLKVLCPKWTVAKADVPELAQLLRTRATMAEFNISVDAAPAVMRFLTIKLSDAEIAAIQKLIPHREFVASWRRLENDAKELSKKLLSKEAALDSGAWMILSSAKPEALLYLDVSGRNKEVDEKIKNFFGKWRQVQEKLPITQMAELRITPQLPEYSRICQDAFLLLLDGKLRSEGEILKFLAPFEPPPPPPPPTPVRRGRAAAKKAPAPVTKPAVQETAKAALEIAKAVQANGPAVAPKAAVESKQLGQKKFPAQKSAKAPESNAKPAAGKNAAKPVGKPSSKLAKAAVNVVSKTVVLKTKASKTKAIAKSAPKKMPKSPSKAGKPGKPGAKSAKQATTKVTGKKPTKNVPEKKKHGQKSGKVDKKHPKRR